MGRPVVLSNGQLFVGLDECGLVHDFYYPYVGLDNLANARSLQHKVGVWVDGHFSWTDDGTWDVHIDYEDKAMISHIIMHSETLQFTLTCTDFVDQQYNALIRRFTLTNEADTIREIRLFTHQVFQISRAGRADTAMYVPDDHYILDYKGRCCLLIAGKFAKGGDFDQYAVGNYGIEGKDGTFRDAEDGELTDNAVEHGGVDSVLRFSEQIGAHESCTVDYWIVAAESQSDAQVVHTRLKYYSIDDRLQATRDYWQKWLNAGGDIAGMQPTVQREIERSLLTIKAHCDARGSILASGDSSIFNFGRDYYCYCWPRDAAYAIWPLIRLGHFDEAKNFFGFARDTMHRDGYLMHKYQPDRSIGSTWHPLIHGRSKELAIQEDETASVVYMLGVFYSATQDKAFIESLYDSFIAPCANFMTGYVDAETSLPHASYDLWEQKFLTSTYTVCTVIAALEAAVKLAGVVNRSENVAIWQQIAEQMRGKLDTLYHPDGYFRKGFLLQEDGTLANDDTLDISSFYGPFMFARLPLDDARLLSMLQHIETQLLNTSPIGGVIRYEADNYFLAKPQFKGNPWIVCSLWLAQYYIHTNQAERGQQLIDWALARAMESGALSEQFDPETGFAIGVTPLVWSHAEFINTSLDTLKRQQ